MPLLAGAGEAPADCGNDGQEPCSYCIDNGERHLITFWNKLFCHTGTTACNPGYYDVTQSNPGVVVANTRGMCRKIKKPAIPPLSNTAGRLKTWIEVKEIRGDISTQQNGTIDVKNAKGYFATIHQPRGAYFQVPNGRGKRAMCSSVRRYISNYKKYCEESESPSHKNEPFCMDVKRPNLDSKCNDNVAVARSRYTCSERGLNIKDAQGNQLPFPMRALKEWMQYSSENKKEQSNTFVMVNANFFDTRAPAEIKNFPHVMPCSDIYGLSVGDSRMVSSYETKEQYKNEPLDAFVVMKDKSGLYDYTLSFKSNQEIKEIYSTGGSSDVQYAVSGFIIAKDSVIQKLPQAGKPNGKAPRTILGLSHNGNRMHIAVFQPGSGSGKDGQLTMTEAANYMINNWGSEQEMKKAKDAGYDVKVDVMVLDGGGSSQFIFNEAGGQKYKYISLPGDKYDGSIVYRPIPNYLLVGVNDNDQKKRSEVSSMEQFEYVGRLYSNDPYLYNDSNDGNRSGLIEDCAGQCSNLEECTHFTFSYPDRDKVCTLFSGEVHGLPAKGDYQLYKKK